MSKEELCALIAKTWKDNGGDAIGFLWCAQLIASEISNLEQQSQVTSTAEPSK